VAACALVVVGLSGMAAAADGLKSLQEALNIVNQEQQAIFQQFQMIQELRRRDAEAARPPAIGQLGPPGNYEDAIAARKAYAERDERYARQLDDLYTRHRDLDRQRRAIMESMQKLRQAPRPSGG
jgi:hypothetical protein